MNTRVFSIYGSAPNAKPVTKVAMPAEQRCMRAGQTRHSNVVASWAADHSCRWSGKTLAFSYPPNVDSTARPGRDAQSGHLALARVVSRHPGEISAAR